ncbi:TolC family protein [Chitinophaga cymbidii]|uniref:Transporter n=1 Tax=Chitinophaga cymbidii TaxID=1096750 RepID=A0A512RRM8_9BACT|nr:TolC family protein [Chitinophaga cymbidii]GEP98357.1 hypothetical protein CCY01nite_46170 [Chitinophaga cymbidii]
MKRILAAILFMAIYSTSWAQMSDTSVLLKLPADRYSVARFKEKLVELALKHPSITEFSVRKEMNKYDKRIATSAWLDRFTAAGNLNEFTINKNSAPDRYNFFPRYNFGVQLPLGHLISIPNNIKRTKAEGRLLDKQRESDQLAIKAKVLQLYEEYAANKILFELHIPIQEDALLSFTEIESKFKKGTDGVTIDQYKEAYNLYNGAITKKVLLERDLRKSKLQLEEIVGMTLEEVMLQI